MSATAHQQALTLGIHPTARGFGWVLFEGPFAPFDWHNVLGQGRDKNVHCLRKLHTLIMRYTPQTLVLEAFEQDNSARNDRVTRLCRGIVALAADLGIGVAIYTRTDIRACFRTLGASTRYEVAEAVARHVPAFRNFMPTKRKPWQSEDRRMALFSAAALVLTHYQLGTSQLFDDLLSA